MTCEHWLIVQLSKYFIHLHRVLWRRCIVFIQHLTTQWALHIVTKAVCTSGVFRDENNTLLEVLWSNQQGNMKSHVKWLAGKPVQSPWVNQVCIQRSSTCDRTKRKHFKRLLITIVNRCLPNTSQADWVILKTALFTKIAWYSHAKGWNLQIFHMSVTFTCNFMSPFDCVTEPRKAMISP